MKQVTSTRSPLLTPAKRILQSRQAECATVGSGVRTLRLQAQKSALATLNKMDFTRYSEVSKQERETPLPRHGQNKWIPTDSLPVFSLKTQVLGEQRVMGSL